jgi:hypothetical protein
VAPAPLLVAPLLGKRAGGIAGIWTVAVGAISGAGAVVVHASTGYSSWLWAALPICLAAGSLLFVTRFSLATSRVKQDPP